MPTKLIDYVYLWLANALDYGISEQEFWEMTLAELERAIESKRRVEKQRAQEKASLNFSKSFVPSLIKSFTVFFAFSTLFRNFDISAVIITFSCSFNLFCRLLVKFSVIGVRKLLKS